MSEKEIHNIFNDNITRREMLKLMGTTTVAGLMGISLPEVTRAASLSHKEKPNIIFILSDNCRWDCMGFMGHPFIKTPGLDRLASEGVVLENAFNTNSLCSPSRASILTGTYAHTHGVLNNHTPWTGQKPTFFEYLKKAGYDTAFIGKWHMPGKGLPEMPYLDLFVSYTYREGQGSYFNCPLIVNGKPEPSQKAYITEEVTHRAIEFMKERIKPDGSRSPFCIYLSHRTAHPPFHAPKGIAGMYNDSKVELPEVVDSWFSRTNGNVYQGIMMGSYENQYRRYCEVITAMDRDIQHLLEQIDQLGLRDNTIIIYMSDNGMMWGEHRRHGIKYPYEESIRLPFIVRCPWLIPDIGTRRSQMALNIDIAPTLLDIAGVAIPSGMEGQSLVPILRDSEISGRNAWLLEYWKYYPENFPSYFGVRTETHKYIEYEKTLKPELFDLVNDPGEQHNLYGTPEGEKLLPELKKMLEALKSGKKLL
ncbi:MAG: sulfatase-like hydrolase/transferase [Deltaproteobacteria bacterium]|nr:sulfatase-like hydrolase/transferase [Deltaproteobacteria bacterium]